MLRPTTFSEFLESLIFSTLTNEIRKSILTKWELTDFLPILLWSSQFDLFYFKNDILTSIVLNNVLHSYVVIQFKYVSFETETIFFLLTMFVINLTYLRSAIWPRLITLVTYSPSLGSKTFFLIAKWPVYKSIWSQMLSWTFINYLCFDGQKSTSKTGRLSGLTYYKII